MRAKATTTDDRRSLRGYLYIAAATFMWGVSATVGRAAFTGRLLPGGQALRAIDPLILSQSRATFSFLVLLPVLLTTRGWRALRLPLADIGRALLLGILGLAAANYFYYFAIQRTNVATAIILEYTAPLWVLLYMIARGRQKATGRCLLAVALAMTGIALVIGLVGSNGFRLDRMGILAGVLAAFAVAVYNISGHGLLARYDHWLALFYTVLSAALFWVVVNPPWTIAAAHYGRGQWLFLLAFSLLSALVPFSFYFVGLTHLEPTSAIVVSCLEPVFSVVIAAIVLGELLRPLQSAGIVLVLAATIVVQMPDRKSKQPATLVETIE